METWVELRTSRIYYEFMMDALEIYIYTVHCNKIFVDQGDVTVCDFYVAAERASGLTTSA
jgi:hypothetical protein